MQQLISCSKKKLDAKIKNKKSYLNSNLNITKEAYTDRSIRSIQNLSKDKSNDKSCSNYNNKTNHNNITKSTSKINYKENSVKKQRNLTTSQIQPEKNEDISKIINHFEVGLKSLKEYFSQKDFKSRFVNKTESKNKNH